MAGEPLTSTAHGAAAAAPKPLLRRRARSAHATAIGVRPGLLLAIPLCAGIACLILPIAVLAARAISDEGVLGFVDVFGNQMFLDALKRTLLLSVVVTAISMVLGTAYALALVAASRWVASLLLGVLFAAFWLSVLVRTFGWVLLFQPNGALDQLLRKLGLIDDSLNLLQTTRAMYPAMVHVLLPFMVLPVYATCQRLDYDLLRAGQSLGARPLAVLRHVLLPQLRPAILGGASLVFMLALSFYITPLLIGGPSQLTIATLIDREFHGAFDFGSAAAMAVVLLVIILVIYAVADRCMSLVPAIKGED